MRFIIDENAPLALVRLLSERGHDAVHVAQLEPRADDASVLARARDERRFLVTFDLDFGRMIVHEGFAPPIGLVQMRGRPADAATIVGQFVALLDDLAIEPVGHFIVIDPDGKFRQLPLP